MLRFGTVYLLMDVETPTNGGGKIESEEIPSDKMALIVRCISIF